MEQRVSLLLLPAVHEIECGRGGRHWGTFARRAAHRPLLQRILDGINARLGTLLILVGRAAADANPADMGAKPSARHWQRAMVLLQST